MPSLKSLKNRVKSIKSTEKITKAMKMVAASKLKKAREKAENSEAYATKMSEIVSKLASSVNVNPGERSLLSVEPKSDKTHALIVLTSDKGLCGAFNSSIIKFFKHKIEDLKQSGKKVKVIFVGKKAHDVLGRKLKDDILHYYHDIGRKGVAFDEAAKISDEVLKLFEDNKFDSCSIIFNKFKSAISQVVTHKQLIPFANDLEVVEQANVPYEYEPSEEKVLEDLLPKNMAIQIYYALLESDASEQGARMTAMDNATRNSGEMIKKLNLVYNRTRQAYITKELIEIISGAQALKAE